MSPSFKVLGAGQVSCHGGSGAWAPGKWRSVRGELAPCTNGLHFVTLEQLPEWLGPEIWAFEPADGTEIVTLDDKSVCRKGRITMQYTQWNERTARLFAADCAEHVLPLFEQKYPSDDRPRRAIETVRRFASGEASRGDLAAARDAAWDGARDVAWPDARDAARAAAGDGAWDAALAAARAAAWDAGWGAARDAALAAAGDAAWDVAWADARDATRDAERKWQAARLGELLGIEAA